MAGNLGEDLDSSLNLFDTPDSKASDKIPSAPRKSRVSESPDISPDSSSDDLVIHHADTDRDVLHGPHSKEEREMYSLYYQELDSMRHVLGDMGMNYFHLRCLFEYVTHSTITRGLNLATLQLAQADAEDKAHKFVRTYYGKHEGQICDNLTALRIKAHCEEMSFHLKHGAFRTQLVHAVTMDAKGIDDFIDSLCRWFPAANEENPFELRERPARATHVVLSPEPHYNYRMLPFGAKQKGGVPSPLANKQKDPQTKNE